VPFWLFSVELEFVRVELEFVRVELEFVRVELEFVRVELESKLAITFDRFNVNRENIKKTLIEKRAKKLLYLSNLM
jgi:hypothetical protein